MTVKVLKSHRGREGGYHRQLLQGISSRKNNTNPDHQTLYDILSQALNKALLFIYGFWLINPYPPYFELVTISMTQYKAYQLSALNQQDRPSAKSQSDSYQYLLVKLRFVFLSQIDNNRLCGCDWKPGHAQGRLYATGDSEERER